MKTKAALDPESWKAFERQIVDKIALIMKEEYAKIVGDRFGSDNGRFEPLTTSTLVDRMKKGFGPTPVMVRTGRLMRSIMADVQIRPAGGNEFEILFPSAEYYAKYHTSPENGGVPTKTVRDPIAFSESDVKKLIAATVARLTG